MLSTTNPPALVKCGLAIFTRLCLVLLAAAVVSCKGQEQGQDLQEPTTMKTITVYIDSGAKQCLYSGHPLAKTEQRLQQAGISVVDSACGVLTGVSFPAVCGGRTEKINLHTINLDNLVQAEQLGFKPIASLQQGELPGFKKVACDQRGVNLSNDV